MAEFPWFSKLSHSLKSKSLKKSHHCLSQFPHLKNKKSKWWPCPEGLWVNQDNTWKGVVNYKELYPWMLSSSAYLITFSFYVDDILGIIYQDRIFASKNMLIIMAHDEYV